MTMDKRVKQWGVMSEVMWYGGLIAAERHEIFFLGNAQADIWILVQVCVCIYNGPCICYVSESS